MGDLCYPSISGIGDPSRRSTNGSPLNLRLIVSLGGSPHLLHFDCAGRFRFRLICLVPVVFRLVCTACRLLQSARCRWLLVGLHPARTAPFPAFLLCCDGTAAAGRGLQDDLQQKQAAQRDQGTVSGAGG